MLIFLSLFVTLVISIHGLKIHEQMTPEEVKSVFQTNHENVPEYEVVPVAHAIHENSPIESPYRILQMRSFKRDIKLYLQPTEGLLAARNTPIWKVKSDKYSPMGIKYTLIPNAMKEMSHFYQDPYNYAALTSSYDEEGEILFDGTIADDLVVRSLPVRLRKMFPRDKRNVTEDFPLFNRTVYHPNLKHTYRHIVFKKKETPIDGMKEKIGSYVLKDKSSRSKRSTDNDHNSISKTAYPQILVVVDYSLYLALQNIPEIKRYVISFWNAVDLRYRVFLNPNIRLNVAGIVIATDPDATPYIQNHRTRPIDGPIVDADLALDDLARYFFRETMDENLQRLVLERDFDMVMVMTQLNLCNYEPNDKDFDCTTLGFAFRGGACTVNMRMHMMEAVGFVEDNGGYMGIVPAAHEVGHLLGAPHDGHNEADKTVCPSYGGYIMTGMLMLTENVFKWSSCSKEYFEDFFNSPRAECVFDHPKNGAAVPRVLPGKILTLDEQCDRIRGTHACNKDESACTHLDCFVPESYGQCIPVAPAAEGSYCGKRKYCINGKCVDRKTSEVLLEFAPPPPAERPFWENNVDSSFFIERG